MGKYELVEYKEMEKLGYGWDSDANTYFKELFFDFNELNKHKGLVTIFFSDNELIIYKGILYNMCINGDELVKNEVDKLVKLNIVKEENNE